MIKKFLLVWLIASIITLIALALLGSHISVKHSPFTTVLTDMLLGGPISMVSYLLCIGEGFLQALVWLLFYVTEGTGPSEHEQS